MACCPDYCRDPPTGMFISVGCIHLLMFCFQVLIYLNLNGVCQFAFPVQDSVLKERLSPRCNGYSTYNGTNMLMELTPFPIQITQIPARKAFLSSPFITFSFLLFSRHHLDLCFTHLPWKSGPLEFNQTRAINPSKSRRCRTTWEICSSSGLEFPLCIWSNAGNWSSVRDGIPSNS